MPTLNEFLEKALEDSPKKEVNEGTNIYTLARQIETKLKQLEKTQGYKEDNNSEFLGPWIDGIRKLLKKV